MKRTLFAIAIVAAAGGCKKDDKRSGGEAPAKAKEQEAPPKKQAGPFDAWDMEARKKAWRGAWDDQGTVIEVEGDVAMKGDKKLAFKLLSPCEAELRETAPDGSSSATITHYTIKDGALIAGLGDAGSKKGKEAIACVSNLIFVLDASGTCTEWKDNWGEGKYEKSPASCGFSADGTRFIAKVRGTDYELLVDGDALLSAQLSSTHYQKK